MTLLRGLAIEDLTRPDLTGNWEYQLSAEMEHGRLSRDAFMAEIAKMAERIVQARPRNTTATPSPATTPRWPRPARNCGGVIKENYRRFACTGASAAWKKAAASRSPRSRPAVPSRPPRPKACIRDKKIGPLEGFRSKAGWPFTAEIKLAFDDRRSTTGSWSSTSATTPRTPRRRRAGRLLGSGKPGRHCPKCKGHVYEHGSNYVCENSVGAPVTCDFKTGKIILQQPVPREEVVQAAGHGQDQPAGELRQSNKTQAQVQGLPGLRRRRKAR